MNYTSNESEMMNNKSHSVNQNWSKPEAITGQLKKISEEIKSLSEQLKSSDKEQEGQKLFRLGDQIEHFMDAASDRKVAQPAKSDSSKSSQAI